MSFKTIDLDITPLTLDELLAALDANSEVLLTRGSISIARVAPAAAVVNLAKRILGLHEGEGWISADFTDELPASFWSGEDV